MALLLVSDMKKNIYKSVYTSLTLLLLGCGSESGSEPSVKETINQTPIISPVNTIYSSELDSIHIELEVTDPENKAVTVLANNLPSWLTFDANSFTLAGEPTLKSSGSYTIAIEASDGENTTTLNVDINVAESVVISGHIIPNYIKGATVYFDFNLNNQLEPDEFQTISDENGYYEFILYGTSYDSIYTTPIRALLDEHSDDILSSNDDFSLQPVSLSRFPLLTDFDGNTAITGQVISPFTHLITQSLQSQLLALQIDAITLEGVIQSKLNLVVELEQIYQSNEDVLFSDFVNLLKSDQQIQPIYDQAFQLLADMQLNANPFVDSDGDGYQNSQDDFPFDASEYLDSDFDGIGDNQDNDDDGDLVIDSVDLFPLDPFESGDFDLDGIGNNADNDDDNDGVLDNEDLFPFDRFESADFDQDSIGNNQDLDDDNDGVFDTDDHFPFNKDEYIDTDNDGVGNSADLDDDGDGLDDTVDLYPLDNTITDLASISEDHVYFSDITVSSNLRHYWGVSKLEHSSAGDYDNLLNSATGMAAGDVNGDGLIDLFINGGDKSKSKLFINNGNGVFSEQAEQSNISLLGLYSGPTLGDTDNDGDLDLFIGALDSEPSLLFINDGDGNFDDAIELEISGHTFASTFGDYDNDGNIDLLVSRYTTQMTQELSYLWRNGGNNEFSNVSDITELNDALLYNALPKDFGYSPAFADINNDLKPDVLLAGDFGHTVMAVANDEGSFDDFSANLDLAGANLNGMGSAVADYDNDGDLDWFIGGNFAYNGSTGGLAYSGNKLLKNDGLGNFKDVTYSAGVTDGGWSWGSCFVDVNNDGHLDIFQTNGWVYDYEGQQGTEPFTNDTVRLFIADGQGKFAMTNTDVGLTDKGQGRSIVCFDADLDGDIDLVINNHNELTNAVVIYENVNGNRLGNFLQITLANDTQNTQALGAKVKIILGDKIQYREVNVNSNFASHNPSQLHFGLAKHSKVDSIEIQWPDGAMQYLYNVSANQHLVINKD